MKLTLKHTIATAMRIMRPLADQGNITAQTVVRMIERCLAGQRYGLNPPKGGTCRTAEYLEGEDIGLSVKPVLNETDEHSNRREVHGAGATVHPGRQPLPRNGVWPHGSCPRTRD